MGRLKDAMMDIGYKAMDIGVQEAAKFYDMSEDDVRACVLFADCFEGNWTDYVTFHNLDIHSGMKNKNIH